MFVCECFFNLPQQFTFIFILYVCMFAYVPFTVLFHTVTFPHISYFYVYICVGSCVYVHNCYISLALQSCRESVFILYAEIVLCFLYLFLRVSTLPVAVFWELITGTWKGTKATYCDGVNYGLKTQFSF